MIVAKPWDVVGFVREIIQCVLDTKPLDWRWRHGGRHLRASLNGAALLDRMRQFMGEELLSLTGSRLILVTGEKDMVLMGKRAGTQLIAQARRFGIAVNPDIAEISSEPRLHVAPNVTGERLTPGHLTLNERLCVYLKRAGAVRLPL